VDFFKEEMLKSHSVAYVTIGVCLVLILLLRNQLTDLALYESSPVDWCGKSINKHDTMKHYIKFQSEINFEVHGGIAEFWNTVSSIPISLVAPIAYRNEIVHQEVWQSFPNVVLVFALIVIIGIGSAYFHGTLSVTGQIMDEMSIFWLVSYSALVVVPPGKHTLIVDLAFQKPVFVAFTLSTTLIGLFLPHLSHLIVLSCVPFGIYVHHQAFNRSKNATTKRRFNAGFVMFCLAWCCWLLDRFLCSYLKRMRSSLGFQPQLHAAWHILIGITSYILFGVCIEFRREFSKRVSRLTGSV